MFVCGGWTPINRRFGFGTLAEEETFRMDFACMISEQEKQFGNGTSRELRSLDDIYKESSQKILESGLIQAEVVVLRLWSVMAPIYQGILRGTAAAPTAAAPNFAITLHVLDSACRKLSRSTPKGERTPGFRSVAGRFLDSSRLARSSFWHELGFLPSAGSHTEQVEAREYAVRYLDCCPAAQQGARYVFKIEGSDDDSWGAHIAWISAHPKQLEVLYPPMSAVNVRSARVVEQVQCRQCEGTGPEVRCAECGCAFRDYILLNIELRTERRVLTLPAMAERERKQEAARVLSPPDIDIARALVLLNAPADFCGQ